MNDDSAGLTHFQQVKPYFFVRKLPVVHGVGAGDRVDELGALMWASEALHDEAPLRAKAGLQVLPKQSLIFNMLYLREFLELCVQICAGWASNKILQVPNHRPIADRCNRRM